jgi:hypothetical protein
LYQFIDFHFFDELEIPRSLLAFEAGNPNSHFYDHLPTEEEIQTLKELPNLYLISNYVNLEIREKKESNKNAEQRFADHIRKEELNIPNSIQNMSYATLLNPKYALLLFRPPHFHQEDERKKCEFEFFSGIVLLPIFSGLKSSECRMICTNYDKKIFWNYKILTRGINKWNYDARESLALNPFTGTKIPLPNQLGNQMEISIFFSILRDFFICIGHENPSPTDVYSMYVQFIIGKNDNDDKCN